MIFMPLSYVILIILTINKTNKLNFHLIVKNTILVTKGYPNTNLNTNWMCRIIELLLL